MARFILTLVLAATAHVIPNVSGAHLHHLRQSVPPVLPSPWASKGCYTDISSSRTLAESSYTSSDAMNVESCIAFCATGGYRYAGVEYGRECYCDYAIQAPGIPVTSDQCNMRCSGSASEFCGAGNRMNIFHDGSADAIVAESISSWKYQGCYADNVHARVLSRRIDIAGGLTPAKCTATCKSGGFSYGGLEYSAECWCGNGLTSSVKVDDNECHMTCSGDRAKFCGGSSRITLYQDSSSNPQGPQTCQQSTVPSLNLRAVYKDTPESNIPIKVIDVNTVPHVGYAILSSCSTCNSAWSFNALQEGALLPKSTTSPMLRTVSYSLVDGESPSFISTQFPPPPYSGYCLMGNALESNGPQMLAANSHLDLWSLCPNSTAGGRIDVVYAAKANHAHYLKSNCREVYLEQV